jgi:hypothetical protein
MKDTIVLKFEVESNLKDTEATMKITAEVAKYLGGFKGMKLTNIGVEYKWNEQQEVKQSDEFLKANPTYYQDQQEWRKKKQQQKAEPKTQSNGKLTEKEFKEYVDNPNKR